MDKPKIISMLKEFGHGLRDYLDHFKIESEIAFRSNFVFDELSKKDYNNLKNKIEDYTKKAINYDLCYYELNVYYDLENIDHLFDCSEFMSILVDKFETKTSIDFDVGVIEFDFENKEFYFSNSTSSLVEDYSPVSMKQTIAYLRNFLKDYGLKHNQENDSIEFCYKKDVKFITKT